MQSTVCRTAPADEAVDMQQLPWIKDGNKLWESNSDRSIISVSARVRRNKVSPALVPDSSLRLSSPSEAANSCSEWPNEAV